MKKWKKVLIISSLCTLAGAFTVLAAPNYDNIAVSKVSGSVEDNANNFGLMIRSGDLDTI